MHNLRQRFTKWYYRKGYRMIYKPCVGADGTSELIFVCPLWVRPLVYAFFSPCTYYQENGYELSNGFLEGLTGLGGSHDSCI